MPRRFIVSCVLISFLVLTAAGVAQANSGPSRLPGEKNGVILPGRTGQVHVLSEQLRFDLADDLRTAKVTARYALENRGPALTNFPVLFVWQAAGQHLASVTWNGEVVPALTPDLSGLSADQRKEMEQAWSAMESAVDPVTGEEYRADYGQMNTQVGYLQFALNLQAGASGTLEVQYQHTAAWDKTRHAHPVNLYQYLLLPARSWASFGPLEIQVKAPGPKQVFFASNLPLKWDGSEYRATLPGLPEQNLAFSFMSRKGLLGKLTGTGPYFAFCFVLTMIGAVLAGIGLGRLSGRIRHRGGAITAGLLSGLFAGGLVDLLLAFGLPNLLPALSDTGYEWLFIGLGTSVLAVVVSTTVAAVVTARTNRRLYSA